MKKVFETMVLTLCLILPLAASGEQEETTQKEVVVTYMQSGTYDVAAEAIEEEFESATGIQADIIASPWAVLNQNHITDLTTGTGEYDVMSGEFWIASVWNHMMPLDDKAKDMESLYIPGIWKPGPSGHFDGKRIGVPYSAEAYGIVYRKDLFDKYGLSADWETWDDFIAVMDKLDEYLAGTGIAPNVHSWGAPDQPMAIFLGMYDSYLVTKDGKYMLDAKEAVPALDKMKSLLKYNPEGAIALSIDESNSVFLTGQAATMIGWVGFVRAEAQNTDSSNIVDMWETAVFPGPGAPFLSAWNLFISKYTDDPESAWAWIDHYVSPEKAKERFVKYGIGSPFKSTYEDPELKEKFAHDFPATIANLNRAKTVPWTFEAYEIFFRNLGEFVIGNIDASAFVSNVNEQWGPINPPEALVQSAASQGQMEK